MNHILLTLANVQAEHDRLLAISDDNTFWNEVMALCGHLNMHGDDNCTLLSIASRAPGTPANGALPARTMRVKLEREARAKCLCRAGWVPVINPRTGEPMTMTVPGPDGPVVRDIVNPCPTCVPHVAQKWRVQ